MVKKMKIVIDGKEVEIKAEDTNIVDVADRMQISLPAPCYRANRSIGCCKVCVVEVNGKLEYACATKPQHDMKVIVNRDDLKALRKERLIQYKATQKGLDKSCECDCSGQDSNCCE